mgnify:CR=1 FL=1
MSHDIRTPMNGIMGMTRIAKENVSEPEKVEFALDKIDSASNQLKNLINDVLDMSKLESGKTILSYEPFNINDIITNLRDVFSEAIAEKGIEFEIKKHNKFSWSYVYTIDGRKYDIHGGSTYDLRKKVLARDLPWDDENYPEDKLTKTQYDSMNCLLYTSDAADEL